MIFFTKRNLILMVWFLYTTTLLSQQNEIYKNNFDHLRTGLYNAEEFKEAFEVNFCKGADEGRVSISSFQDKGNVLKVKYPKGKVKTNDSGMHTKVYWENYESFDELYFSYRVYIPADFEFRAGAKLPGLAYQTRDRNMSLRLMWRRDGLLEFYNHFQTRPTWSEWKASVNWSLIDPYNEPGGPQPDQVKLKKGQWNHIEVYHKLNTAGENNGIMRGWLNEELAIDITDNGDYRQNNEEDIRLNTIYLSTFFGGSSNDYKPTKDQYAYFDDFIVSKTRINDNGDDNNNPISVSFKNPENNIIVQEGYELDLEVIAKSITGKISDVKLYVNDNFIRKERKFPYTWGHSGSPNPNELNNLIPGVYNIKAVATNDKGQTNQTYLTLTVQSDTTCSLILPDTKGVQGLDNVYYNYVHIMGVQDASFLSNFVNLSIKWSAKYNTLYKFALITDNGYPDWYVDFSKTAHYQLRNPQPEITLNNTGFDGLDDTYWVTLQNDELIMKSQNKETLVCFSNSSQPPLCMIAKHQSITSINNAKNLRLYPNPVKNQLFIRDLPSSAYRVDIYTLHGQRVISNPISSKQENLKMIVNTLHKGIYFIKIWSLHQEVKQVKFIKD